MLRLKRHIVTEVIENFLAVIIALILIMVSFHFAKLLSQAAEGKIIGSAVYQLVALQTVKFFVLLAPFAFFIAMLMALSRLATDNELIAMHSVGFSLGQIYQALFSVAIPLTMLISFMSLQVLPNVLSLNYKLLEKARGESELSIMQPGQFRTIGGNTTIFVADIDNRSFSNFFVWQNNDGDESITVAKKGQQYQEEDDRYIDLHNGSRYTMSKDNTSQLIDFELLTLLLPKVEPTNRSEKLKARSTATLLKSNDLSSKIELQRRISPMLSILLLVICAPLLVQFNPRENRYGKFVIAILIYAIYANSQYVIKSFIQSGSMPLYPGMFVAHLIFIVILILWAMMRFATSYTKNTDKIVAGNGGNG